jgi:hypothetical protein
VAPGRSLPFFLSVLGAFESSRLGVENPSENAHLNQSAPHPFQKPLRYLALLKAEVC